MSDATKLEMPGLLHSLGTRLREYVGDRRRALRRAARVTARLPLAVAPLDDVQDVRDDLAGMRTLAGCTRDLSGTGLTLLLPAVRVGGRYITDREGYLGVRLDLPDGPLCLLAVPARFEQLDASAEEYSFLLAVRIIKMAESEGARYLAYLSTLASNDRRAAERERAGAVLNTSAAGQANVWDGMTPVFVAEAFNKFASVNARPRKS